MKREPSLLHVGKRNSLLNPGTWLKDHDLGPGFSVDSHNLSLEPPSMRRTQHVCPLTNEPAPVADRPKGTLARRRHLKHVRRLDETASVQPSFNCARYASAIVDRDRRSVAPIDSNLDQWPIARAAAPQLNEIEANRVKFSDYNLFQRVLHMPSRKPCRTKKCGELPPHSTRGTNHRAADVN